MKITRTFITAGSVVAFLLVTALCINSFGDIDGRTGRTRKTSTSGCGSCHGGSSTAGVSVTLNGPDTVTAGQTQQFSLVINRSGQTGAGLDIATRRGSLSAVTSGTRVQSGEIVHNDDLPMSSNSITILFNYNAPATTGLDTIWATGLASNSNGGASGDQWNWSANRPVYVRMATGIGNSEAILQSFDLKQNFPNPFNPQTTVYFSIPQLSHVTLSVYDASGKRVATLVDDKRHAGSYSVTFNADQLPSGIYYYTLTDGEFSSTKKMMLLK